MVAQIAAAGGRAAAIRADMAPEEEIVTLFAEAEAALGPLYGLVNNAGVSGGFACVADLTAAALDEVLRVNVAAPFLCAREAVRRLSTARGGPGGVIVNISSITARIGGAGEWVHYAASKGAIETLTVGLAREVAAEGVRVNAVAPGLISSDFHTAAGAPDRPARMAPAIPMRRAGSPEEMLWLLSPAAAYVIGAILDVGGGRQGHDTDHSSLPEGDRLIGFTSTTGAVSRLGRADFLEADLPLPGPLGRIHEAVERGGSHAELSGYMGLNHRERLRKAS